MSDLSHLRLENTATVLNYTSTDTGRGAFSLPPRDRVPHAQGLIAQLQRAVVQADTARQQQQPTAESLDGYSLTVRSDPGYPLKLDSLDRRTDGMELLSARTEANAEVANVFVRRDKVSRFIRLMEQYRDADTRRGAPRNRKLIESIAGIQLAAVRDLWQENASAQFPNPDEQIWWEIWIRTAGTTPQDAFEQFSRAAELAEVQVKDHYVHFPERVVLLARGTARQLGQSTNLLAWIAELRRAKQVPTAYLELPPRDQHTLATDIVRRLMPPSGDAPVVCLLDTGVNRQHPLLDPLLSVPDTQAVDPQWGTADHDSDQHGTGMAGVAAYRCLRDVISGNGPVQLRHRLESVKLLPPPPEVNEPDMYGWVTQQAVYKAEIQAPRRNRAVCMAITADDRDRGLPSSWSAAVDQMCAGELDQRRRLMFISAGNYDAVVQNPAYVYPDWNLSNAGIQDPAQSWNAVTVGAYTDMWQVQDPYFRGWMPIAPPGDLTPSSRTSTAWSEENYEWPFKPDIVMEGGNYITDGQDRSNCPDMALMTTMLHPSGRLFTYMGDTSAATASAARLAAIIWSQYPRFWPETVRGLLIHSAEWTPAMLSRIPGERKVDAHRRLRCYGYGVPSLQRALWSAESAATMIFEGELQPFDKVGSEYKTKEMHLHQIPWPTEVLQQLGDVKVRMRVTLSYFIEPGPGRKGWGEKNRFQSHGLRFEVINPLENETEFARRITRAMWEDQNQRPTNVQDSRNWVVGVNGRTRGSIHSDWWIGSAAELAACGRLAVYPVTGWWRERQHLQRWSRRARYSLIVSIESPEVEIDLYTPIVNQTTVSAELEV